MRATRDDEWIRRSTHAAIALGAVTTCMALPLVVLGALALPTLARELEVALASIVIHALPFESVVALAVAIVGLGGGALLFVGGLACTLVAARSLRVLREREADARELEQILRARQGETSPGVHARVVVDPPHGENRTYAPPRNATPTPAPGMRTGFFFERPARH